MVPYWIELIVEAIFGKIQCLWCDRWYSNKDEFLFNCCCSEICEKAYDRSLELHSDFRQGLIGNNEFLQKVTDLRKQTKMLKGQ